MQAVVGDHVVVEGTRPGSIRRDGEIVALHHPDGTPPYDVHWEHTDQTTIFFPGPDTHVIHKPGGIPSAHQG